MASFYSQIDSLIKILKETADIQLVCNRVEILIDDIGSEYTVAEFYRSLASLLPKIYEVLLRHSRNALAQVSQLLKAIQLSLKGGGQLSTTKRVPKKRRRLQVRRSSSLSLADGSPVFLKRLIALADNVSRSPLTRQRGEACRAQKTIQIYPDYPSRQQIEDGLQMFPPRDGGAENAAATSGRTVERQNNSSVVTGREINSITSQGQMIESLLQDLTAGLKLSEGPDLTANPEVASMMLSGPSILNEIPSSGIPAVLMSTPLKLEFRNPVTRRKKLFDVIIDSEIELAEDVRKKKGMRSKKGFKAVDWSVSFPLPNRPTSAKQLFDHKSMFGMTTIKTNPVQQRIDLILRNRQSQELLQANTLTPEDMSKAFREMYISNFHPTIARHSIDRPIKSGNANALNASARERRMTSDRINLNSVEHYNQELGEHSNLPGIPEANSILHITDYLQVPSGGCTFESLIPAHSQRRCVSRLFSHLLSGAAQGKVAVFQAESYGEIVINPTENA